MKVIVHTFRILLPLIFICGGAVHAQLPPDVSASDNPLVRSSDAKAGSNLNTLKSGVNFDATMPQEMNWNEWNNNLCAALVEAFKYEMQRQPMLGREWTGKLSRKPQTKVFHEIIEAGRFRNTTLVSGSIDSYSLWTQEATARLNQTGSIPPIPHPYEQAKIEFDLSFSMTSKNYSFQVVTTPKVFSDSMARPSFRQF